MSLELFAHPFSSYCWKALIALYENDIPFTYRSIANGDPDEPANAEALKQHWPLGKFPLLVDGGRAIPETSIIIEYLQDRSPGPVRLIPANPDAALEVRLLDRLFDNHVMTNASGVVAEHLPFLTPTPDQARIVRAKAALDLIYRWLDARLNGRCWAAGEDFSLADCAGAPALFYADWVHPIPDELATLKDYRARVLARPSVARCVDEARPYRHYFPLGAPDRD